MANSNCECGCKPTCTLLAIIASIILGIATAILQITGVITVTPAFLWVVFGIAVVYLAVLVIAAAAARGTEKSGCRCSVLKLLLIGILGSALLSVLLLGVGIVATILNSILVGALLFFLSLLVTTTACLVQCLSNCHS